MVPQQEPYRSPLRRHDRDRFYKYMPFDTAKVVLTNRTVRWSSPLVFNDLFDVPRELGIGFTPEEFRDAMIEEFALLLTDPGRRDVSGFPELRRFLEVAKNGPPDLRLATAAFTRTLADRVDLRFLQRAQDDFRAYWREHVPEMRILCLTDSNSNDVMWGLYAESNKGAVLEFKCIDELETAFLLARRVQYTDELPLLATIEDAMRVVFTGGRIFKPSEVSRKYYYTKKASWAYEQEWRVHSFKSGNDSGTFADQPFNPGELGAVYVGAAMSEANIDAIRRLLVGDLAHVSLHKCVPVPGERKFDFRPL